MVASGCQPHLDNFHARLLWKNSMGLAQIDHGSLEHGGKKGSSTHARAQKQINTYTSHQTQKHQTLRPALNFPNAGMPDEANWARKGARKFAYLSTASAEEGPSPGKSSKKGWSGFAALKLWMKFSSSFTHSTNTSLRRASSTSPVAMGPAGLLSIEDQNCLCTHQPHAQDKKHTTAIDKWHKHTGLTRRYGIAKGEGGTC